MRLKYVLSCLLSLLVWYGGFSPATSMAKPSANEKITLLAAIEKISRDYDVYFTFDMTLVSKVEVQYESKWYKSAEEAISRVLKGTGIKYQFYESRFVILYKDDASGLESLRQMSKHLNGLISEGEKKMASASMNNSLTAGRLPNESILKEVRRVAFSVEGTVNNQEGEPLIGVTIQVKGTTRTTTTDNRGHFSLTDIDANAVLIFSYVGFELQEVKLGGRLNVDVVMVASTQDMGEVVVTALGLSREKKSLGYSVGEVSNEKLNETPQNSVLSALQGKVSGVKINQTYGLAGSSIQMSIRGEKSLGNNDPLYIIDGVPITNTGNGVFKGIVDLGNAISDLNPDDIESISVLKGPSAAALYGTRAGNGVVLITTKSGKGAHKGIGVSFNSSVLFDKPYKFFPLQYEFASSKTGAHSYDELAFETWGPKLNNGFMAEMWNTNGEKVELISYPNRVEEFYQTGQTTTNNLGFTSKSDNVEVRISGSNAINKGITPNTGFEKNNISINGAARLARNLKISGVFNIHDGRSDNRPSFGGGYLDPMRMLFAMGPQQNIDNFKDYWVKGLENIQQLTYYPVNGNRWNNPYFIANEYLTGYRRTQGVYKLQADWEFYKNLSLMVRYTRNDFNQRVTQRAAFSEKDNTKGLYSMKYDHNRENNWEGMIGYTKNNVVNKVNLIANVGGSVRYNYFDYISNETGKLIDPNLYNISNAAPGTLVYNGGWSEKQVNSVFGIVSLSYANSVYLDLTARNDWSSTLPSNNRSYFYPSASLSVLMNEIVKLPHWVSLAKLRAGYAQVGKDTDPYTLSKSISTEQDWGSAPRKFINGSFPNANLKPEIATSYEFGSDIILINNRVRLDVTYYEMENRNQIFQLAQPVISGATSRTVNAGLIKSRGWDLSLNINVIKKRDLNVDLGTTFTRNRTSIKELAEGVFYIQNNIKSGEAILRTYIGDDIGSIYQFPYKRVEDKSSPYYGFPVLTANGITEVNRSKDDVIELIGNYNPDFIMGGQLNVRFKRLSLFAGFDWRSGGEFYSRTMEFMKNNGMLAGYNSGEDYNANDDLRDQILANPEKYINTWIGGRDSEYGGLPWPVGQGAGRVDDASFIPGVRVDNNGNYIENFGNPETTKFLSPYDASKYAERYLAQQNLYSSTYVKLREISLRYDFSRELVSKLKLSKLSLALVAQNVFQWNKSGIFVDPENAYFLGSEGTEYYSVIPRTRSIGLKLNIEL